MKPFQRADVPHSQAASVIDDLVNKWQIGEASVAEPLGHPQTLTDARAAAKALVDRIIEGEWWRNDTHQVVTRGIDTPLGPMVHLSIRRLDRSPIHDWRELQDVKSTLLGPNVEGVELYPAEDRVVDTANQYHLWCSPPGVRWPFGFESGRVVTEASVAGSVQRPFAKPDAGEYTPADLRAAIDAEKTGTGPLSTDEKVEMNELEITLAENGRLGKLNMARLENLRARAATELDAALVERAVRAARPNRTTEAPRWVAIVDTFGIGCTSATELCRRFGLDPHERVSGARCSCPDSEGGGA